MSNLAFEIDSCFDQYNMHRAHCRHCGPELGNHCRIGRSLLKDAAKQAERKLSGVLNPTAKA